MKRIAKTQYFEGQHAVIEFLLKKSLCYVACDRAYPDQIVGYIIGELNNNQTILHWIYVKSGFRKMGIAKKLIQALRGDKEGRIWYTHDHYEAQDFKRKVNMEYNPYLAK